MVHIYNGLLLSHEKEQNMAFAATWMDSEIIIIGEVNQRKTNTIYIIYVWNLKYDANELIYETETGT